MNGVTWLQYVTIHVELPGYNVLSHKHTDIVFPLPQQLICVYCDYRSIDLYWILYKTPKLFNIRETNDVRGRVSTQDKIVTCDQCDQLTDTPQYFPPRKQNTLAFFHVFFDHSRILPELHSTYSPNETSASAATPRGLFGFYPLERLTEARFPSSPA